MKPVLVITCNHFDPTWRRCFDRPLIYGGRSFVSYAALEAFYIEDNLKLARASPDYRFDVESVLVLRKYLRDHPERLEELRQLRQEGRFGVGGCGDNVIDANMVLGESIVRNFVRGQAWLGRTFAGYAPRLALRNDGFGNSAQLPQILRGCGFTAVAGLSYSTCDRAYWRGLDGTAIRVVKVPEVAYGGSSWRKYAPCPECDGRGCAACDHRGIAPGTAPLPGDIDRQALAKAATPCAMVQLNSEELLPNPGILDWVREQARTFNVRFGLLEDLLRAVEGRPVEPPPTTPAGDIHAGELNPNNSGCLVTRIKTKQVCRRQEHALLATETLALLAGGGQLAAHQRVDLDAAWDDLLFTMFHDAITATHVDAAYAELGDIWNAIDRRLERLRAGLCSAARPKEAMLTVVNPRGVAATELVTATVDRPVRALRSADGETIPVADCTRRDDGGCVIRFVAPGVPAFGTAGYRLVDGAAPVSRPASGRVIENQRYRITADEHGLTEIYDKTLKAVLSATNGYRPAEIVLERDYGSPWATLHADRTRAGLAPHTRLVRVERTPACQRFVLAGICPTRLLANQCRLEFTLTVTLHTGLDRIAFDLDADWDSHNLRARLALPSAFDGAGVYGIPYGLLQRPEYAPQHDDWTGANGDWPATEWAGIQGEEISLALFGQGLPAFCTEPAGDRRTLFLSFLRSPTDGTYLNEPESYSMPEYFGMRDAGRHRFQLAVQAYGAPFAESSVQADAAAFSGGLWAFAGEFRLPEAPVLESAHAVISAIKPPETGTGIVLRIVEQQGRGGKAVLRLPAWLSHAAVTDMMEHETQPLRVRQRRVALALRPWQIMTLRLE